MDFRWQALLRDVAIVFVLTAFGGFVVGLTGVGGQRAMLATAFSNLLFGTVGFAIVGCLNPNDRVRQLALVAAISWVLGLLPVMLGAYGPGVWAASVLLFVVTAGLGGAVSLLFVPRPRASPTSETGA